MSLVYMNLLMSNGTQPEWVTHIMNYIGKKTGMNDQQIKKMPDVVTIDDWSSFRDGLSKQPNKTQIGIMFCVETDISTLGFCDDVKNSYSYFLILNKTDSFGVIFADPTIPLPKDPVALSLKVIPP